MADCKIESCTKPSRNEGWCQMHYKRHRRHGDPNVGAAKIRGACSADDCERPHHARGYCKTHWEINHRHGEPGGGRRSYRNSEDSFSARTVRSGECLVWTGSAVKGYGSMYGPDGKMYAHRYAWERANGPIPEGMVVDHMCFNTMCVEVSHLRLATNAENGRNRSGASVLTRSGIRGVFPRGNRWFAQVGMLGNAYYLGTYDTKESAAMAVRLKREELFGEFAGKE